MLQHAKLVIFSVEHKSLNPSDNVHHTEAIEEWMKLNDIPFQRLVGMYKGDQEASFAVPGRFQRIIESIARDYEQESILVRDHDLSCTLVYLKDNSTQDLGQWQEVQFEELQYLDSYTIEESTGRYFAARKGGV